MLEGKTVVVTGATGFLGKRLCQNLRDKHAYVVEIKHSDCNLCDYSDVKYYFENARPDYVIHAAAKTGNIKFNGSHPADVWIENTAMNMFVLKAAHRVKAKKFVGILSSCAFDHSQQLITPQHIWQGRPHPSVEAFGMAKRNLWELVQYYQNQYKFNAITVCPTGIYGDGCGFDLERNKVLESIVRRVVDAHENGDKEVTFWGTGWPMREFIYVGDASELIVRALLSYTDTYLPLLLGTRDEFTIANLVQIVVDKVGFGGRVKFDTSMPDGQQRKKLSTDMVDKLFPDFQFTPFGLGLERLINDYYTYLEGEKCSNLASPLTA